VVAANPKGSLRKQAEQQCSISSGLVGVAQAKVLNARGSLADRGRQLSSAVSKLSLKEQARVEQHERKLRVEELLDAESVRFAFLLKGVTGFHVFGTEVDLFFSL
jgi:hypothetical protein